jgi:3-oxoacyl-[acyl-carrier protein] reductase
MKVAIVTGGSRGIGSAIATRLAADGVGVGVNYCSNQVAADDLVAKIGNAAFAVQADIGDPDQVVGLFDATQDHFGGVDVLVYNANTNATFSTVAEARAEEFDATFVTNTRAMFVAFREAANRLRDGGRIVFVSSGATTFHLPGFGLYSAAKAAGEQFVRTLAHELGPRGITVNSVLPGPTRTASFDDRPSGADEHVISRTPLGRLGRPADIADIVGFLVSDDGRWLTGQSINAGGGMF